MWEGSHHAPSARYTPLPAGAAGPSSRRARLAAGADISALGRGRGRGRGRRGVCVVTKWRVALYVIWREASLRLAYLLLTSQLTHWLSLTWISSWDVASTSPSEIALISPPEVAMIDGVPAGDMLAGSEFILALDTAEGVDESMGKPCAPWRRIIIRPSTSKAGARQGVVDVPCKDRVPACAALVLALVIVRAVLATAPEVTPSRGQLLML